MLCGRVFNHIRTVPTSNPPDDLRNQREGDAAAAAPVLYAPGGGLRLSRLNATIPGLNTAQAFLHRPTRATQTPPAFPAAARTEVTISPEGPCRSRRVRTSTYDGHF